jgi:mannose-6-phosphate isomerase-like protein (cupin superfamily)
MNKVTIADKLSLITRWYDPKIVGELNGQHVKLVKFKGEFDWHHHENEDELFLVIDGELDLQLEAETLRVRKGEFVIVPRGVEHCPKAEEEVHVLLFEPASTLNTGSVLTDKTKRELERI